MNTNKNSEEELMPAFKIIMLGDSNVGKTSLLTRLVSNSFSQYHVSTLGMMC